MIKLNTILKCKCIKSTFNSEKDIEVSVSTDTRNIQEGEFFVSLYGPSFDGNNFLISALESGAAGVIFRSENSDIKSLKAKFPNKILVEVTDTYEFLKEVGNLRVKEFKSSGGLVIGLTGTNGKTTHKEILFQLLEPSFKDKVCCTKGNLNNHIGVPLTILDASYDDEIMIVEMGTNHPGEIKTLCEIAEPDCGYITNVGHGHLEFLHNLNGVFVEKSELYKSVKSRNGIFLINEDDSNLKTLNSYENSHSIGKEGKDFKVSLEKNGFSLSIIKNEISINNKNISEDFNLMNLSACLILAFLNFPDKIDSFLKAASSVKLPDNNRSSWIEVNGKNIFLDAYNANPSSVEASLNAFVENLIEKNISMREVLVCLGDMNELGEESDKLHTQIGNQLSELQIINATFIGRFSAQYKKGFPVGNCFSSAKDYSSEWKKDFDKFKYFFIKGSRTLQLESLVDIVRAK